MIKIHKKEAGFGTVELIMVIVIIALVGVVGWMVYKNHHKSTTKSVVSTAKTSPVTPAKPTTPSKPANPTSSWYLYTSPGNTYSMRIPDGWDLTQNGTDNLSPLLLYPDSTKTLAINQGTKGVITVQSPAVGRDATPTLNIQWYTLADAQSQGALNTTGTQQTSLQTSSGSTIQKFYFYEANPSTNLSQPQQGTYYTYIIKNSTSVLVTSYYFAPGQKDYHSNVEKALETVSLN